MLFRSVFSTLISLTEMGDIKIEKRVGGVDINATSKTKKRKVAEIDESNLQAPGSTQVVEQSQKEEGPDKRPAEDESKALSRSTKSETTEPPLKKPKQMPKQMPKKTQAKPKGRPPSKPNNTTPRPKLKRGDTQLTIEQTMKKAKEKRRAKAGAVDTTDSEMVHDRTLRRRSTKCIE